VFKAKNLPPDPQTLLQHPVWPTSILFLWDTNTMAVGTGYKELRLYDVRESSKVRRPIARSTSEGGPIEYRVTSLCQVGDFELAVGDAAGYIYSMDIRKLDKSNISRSKSENLGRYVGPAGSVRQLKKHPTLPRMAAVGLDRMLRVYDTNKRKELDCFYLKQRLTCVLFGSDDDWRPGSSSHGEGTADEDQDIDQDDLVQDYVDSDDGGDSEKDNADHVEENDDEDISVSAGDAEESSNEEQDISRSFQEEEEDDDDDSSQEDSSQDNSDLDGDDIPSVNTKESTEGSDESDEEVVVKAPTKKRRKR
jgi:ribosome biogenesis protein NSA1